MKNIFLDLDGVMADFEKYFASHFGFKHDSVSDAEMWKHIDAHGNFFGSLPPMEGAVDFFWDLWNTRGKEDMLVLTACPRTNYAKAAAQKIDWVHKHLDSSIHVLPVLGGKNKCLFMKKKGDILIDDFDKNIYPWRDRGGVGIIHRGFESTWEQLKEAGVGN